MEVSLRSSCLGILRRSFESVACDARLAAVEMRPPGVCPQTRLSQPLVCIQGGAEEDFQSIETRPLTITL